VTQNRSGGNKAEMCSHTHIWSTFLTPVPSLMRGYWLSSVTTWSPMGN